MKKAILSLFLFAVLYPAVMQAQTAADFYEVGIKLSDDSSYANAIAAFNSALQLDTLYPAAYYERGIAKAYSGDTVGGVADIRKAIKLHPDYPKAYYMLGCIKGQSGKNDSAFIYYNIAIQHDSCCDMAYNNRGVLYKKKGDLKKAVADYNQALKLNPANVDALSNLSVTCLEKAQADKKNEKQFLQEGLKYINRAIEIDSAFSTSYCNRGSILSTLGDSNDAIRDYLKAIQIKPTMCDAWYNLGLVYYNLGRTVQGCSCIKKAAALGQPIAPNAYRDLCN